MTLPAENQQTVEAALDYLERITLSLGPGERTERLSAARAALRDLVAQAELAAELGDALRKIERTASRAHDRMWEMNFDKTSAGRFEREQWTRLRKAASDQIWKLHNVARPLLARLEQGEALRDGRTEGASLDGAR